MLRRVPNKGIGYGLLKYLTAPGKRPGLSSRGKSFITFNYLGQFDEDIDTDFYRMADISQGDAISKEYEREYPLEITGIIVGQTLTMAVIYNQEEYNRETIAALAGQYRQGLCQLIQHCVSKEETELTVSDLTSADFDQQEMEDILEGLGED
jgi:non-ribosomal peptide synthase protein (TIGR01720 family)